MKIKHKILGDPPIAIEETPDPPMFRERYGASHGAVAIPRGSAGGEFGTERGVVPQARSGRFTPADLAAIIDALEQLDWVVWFKSYLAAQRGNGASAPPADAITPATPPVPVSPSPDRKAPKMAHAPEVVDEKTLRYARRYREKLEQYAKHTMREKAAGISWQHNDNPDNTRRNAVAIRAQGDQLIAEALAAEDETRDARHALSKKALQRALRMNISYEDALADITGEDIRSRPLIGSTARVPPDQWSPATAPVEVPRGTVGGRFG